MESLDAIIVGPYLFGLTCDVAGEFPDKTLLVPCFHDEVFARLRKWVGTYEGVGGILYHTTEEQDFAQSELGINHPRGSVIGTWLPCAAPEVEGSLQGPEGVSSRYLVYCGRYSQQKGLGELLEFARRYQEQRPDRFRFLFLGQGEVRIPRESWAHDCGFVDEQCKLALLAGAGALVQLSRQESLSLVTLEAWAHGTPCIVNAHCAVLAGQVRRSGGGRAIDGYEEFACALDDLWEHPAAWRAQGQSGREYVRREYADAHAFTKRLVEAIESLSRPIGDEMRRRGLARASKFSRAVWRATRRVRGRFAARRTQVWPQRDRDSTSSDKASMTAETKTVLLPVRVLQHGTLAALAEGPGRTVLCSQVLDAETGRPVQASEDGSLPGLLIPGRAQAAAVSVHLPSTPGSYQIALWTECVDQRDQDADPLRSAGPALVDLIVENGATHERPCCAPLLDIVHSAVGEAHGKQTLPDDYVDVTEGILAGLKKGIKRKVLGNFKHAYVDVLSRQQSHVNQQLVTAVQHLAECCATLDHALQTLQRRVECLEERLSTQAQVIEKEETSVTKK